MKFDPTPDVPVDFCTEHSNRRLSHQALGEATISLERAQLLQTWTSSFYLFPGALRIWFRTPQTLQFRDHCPSFEMWNVFFNPLPYAGVELPNCETTRVLAAGPVERSEAVPWAQAAAVRAAHAPPLTARGQSSIFYVLV